MLSGQDIDGCLEKLWDILAPPPVRDDNGNPHRPRHSPRTRTPE